MGEEGNFFYRADGEKLERFKAVTILTKLRDKRYEN